jgi:hypothetical protein
MVRQDGQDYAVLMRRMVGVPLRLLRRPVGSIAQCRDDLSRGIDRLFFGD